MQFNLDFGDNKGVSPEGHFDFTKEVQRIKEENLINEVQINQEEVSTKEVELFLGKFESEESYIEERKKVADKYNVLYPEKIEFRENDWYMKDSLLTVEEWDNANKTEDFDYKSGQK